MTQNIFMDTLRGRETPRPPVWFMRQAGRVLPRYRQLRERYSFHELMHDPDLCAEVTLMPVDDIGVDAAILFSDILVVPVALGMQLEWTDRGPAFTAPLSGLDAPCSELEFDARRLEYIYHAIDAIRARRAPSTPLIGFCGAPLTVLCYMLQGAGGKSDFPRAVSYFYTHPEETRHLIDKVTEATVQYALGQIAHGIDCFQIFDSLAGVVPEDMYLRWFMPAVSRIARAVRQKGIPVIYFPKGIGHNLTRVTSELCDIVGIDWHTDIFTARRLVDPAVGLQGNLDPRLLYAPEETIARQLDRLAELRTINPRWILNLGHGVPPDCDVEKLKFIVNQIRNISSKS